MAHSKRWGYFETIEYLERMELAYGYRAALFELALVSKMTEAEAKLKSPPKKPF